MITVLNHGKYYNPEAEYYRFRCSCGCDFVCSKWDLKDSDTFVKEKKYVVCPDCKEKNYIRTSGFIMPIKDLNSKVVLNSNMVECLTTEEFNMLTNPKNKE